MTFTTSIVALRATKTTSKRSATFVVRFNMCIILFAFLFPVRRHNRHRDVIVSFVLIREKYCARDMVSLCLARGKSLSSLSLALSAFTDIIFSLLNACCDIIIIISPKQTRAEQ